MKIKRTIGLDKNTFPRHARQYMDYDYIHKLNYAEQIYLSDFNDEWYGNKLSKKSKTKKKYRKFIYSQTNQRYRDIYSRWLKCPSNDGAYTYDKATVEDTMLQLIELLKEFKKNNITINDILFKEIDQFDHNILKLIIKFLILFYSLFYSNGVY